MTGIQEGRSSSYEDPIEIDAGVTKLRTCSERKKEL